MSSSRLASPFSRVVNVRTANALAMLSSLHGVAALAPQPTGSARSPACFSLMGAATAPAPALSASAFFPNSGVSGVHNPSCELLGYFHPPAALPFPCLMPGQRVAVGDYLSFVESMKALPVAVLLLSAQEATYFTVNQETQFVLEPVTEVFTPSLAAAGHSQALANEEQVAWLRAVGVSFASCASVQMAATLWHRATTTHHVEWFRAGLPSRQPGAAAFNGAVTRDDPRWLRLCSATANMANPRLMFKPEHMAREMQYARFDLRP